MINLLVGVLSPLNNQRAGFSIVSDLVVNQWRIGHGSKMCL